MHIHIDSDGGCDDVLALLWLAAGPMSDPSVSAVAGNVPAARAAANLDQVLHAVRPGTETVLVGAERPLCRAAAPAPTVHGEHGLGDLVGGPIVTTSDVPTVVEKIRMTVTGNEPAGLLCLGPLTNSAITAAMHPDVFTKDATVVIMGGTRDGSGNVTPTAEYNFWADPEAAGTMLATDCEPIVVGLDSLRAGGAFTAAEWERVVAASPEPWRPLLEAWAQPLRRWKEPGTPPGGVIVPDLVAAVALEEPAVISTSRHRVQVLADFHMRGVVTDGGEHTARWARAVDGRAVTELVAARFATLPDVGFQKSAYTSDLL